MLSLEGQLSRRRKTLKNHKLVEEMLKPVFQECTSVKDPAIHEVARVMIDTYRYTRQKPAEKLLKCCASGSKSMSCFRGTLSYIKCMCFVPPPVMAILITEICTWSLPQKLIWTSHLGFSIYWFASSQLYSTFWQYIMGSKSFLIAVTGWNTGMCICVCDYWWILA